MTEQNIIDAIGENSGAMTILDVIDFVAPELTVAHGWGKKRERDAQREDLRSLLWAMIARHELKLTNDLTLEVNRND